MLAQHVEGPNLVPSTSKNKNKKIFPLALWDSPHTSGGVIRMLKSVWGAGRIAESERKKSLQQSPIQESTDTHNHFKTVLFV